jgi:hypothetical protein
VIVSASRRTDIPAAFPEWMIRRLRAGFCEVANPRRPEQVSRIDLRPEAVDVLVFWSKNPAPFVPYLDKVDALGYRYYFLFTLNAYPAVWEPGMPPLAERLATFRRLAARLGAARVVWRYDPIILSRRLNADFHARTFAALAAALEGSTERVIVSVLDRYDRIRARLAAAERLTDDRLEPEPEAAPELHDLLRAIAASAAARGMAVQTCAEPDARLRAAGIQPGACIDAGMIERVFGLRVSVRKDPAQRRACACAVSRDIGALDTCPAGCVYCYAAGGPRAPASGNG